MQPKNVLNCAQTDAQSSGATPAASSKNYSTSATISDAASRPRNTLRKEVRNPQPASTTARKLRPDCTTDSAGRLIPPADRTGFLRGLEENEDSDSIIDHLLESGISLDTKWDKNGVLSFRGSARLVFSTSNGLQNAMKENFWPRHNLILKEWETRTALHGHHPSRG